MKAEIFFRFEGVTKEEIQQAMQAMRDVEQKDPKRIELFILANVQDLSQEETKRMLSELRPPLPYMVNINTGSVAATTEKGEKHG